jgi:hypothetical protein
MPSEQAKPVEEKSAAHKLLNVVNLLCVGGVGVGDDGARDEGGGEKNFFTPGWKVDSEGRGVYNSVLVNW